MSSGDDDKIKHYYPVDQQRQESTISYRRPPRSTVDDQGGDSIGRKWVNIQECRWLTSGDWNQVTRAGLQYRQGGLLGPDSPGIMDVQVKLAVKLALETLHILPKKQNPCHPYGRAHLLMEEKQHHLQEFKDTENAVSQSSENACG